MTCRHIEGFKKDARRFTDEAGALLATAKAEGRSMTDRERKQFDRLHEHIAACLENADSVERNAKLGSNLSDRAMDIVNSGFNADDGFGSGRAVHRGDPAEIFLDENGSEVRALAPDESYAERLLKESPAVGEYQGFSLAKYIRGLATGSWENAGLERRALDTSLGTAGGVPDIVSAETFDILRNRSAVLSQAVRTVPMESKQLSYAKLTGDVSCGWKSENATISASTPTFAAVTLNAETLTAIVNLSEELAADSINVEQMIRDAIAGKMAETLDASLLAGDGTDNEPLGLIEIAGVQAIAVDGNLTAVGSGTNPFQNFIAGISAVRTANATPTGICMSEREWATLASAADTTGQPLRPPAVWDELRKTATNQISGATTYAVVGDWTRCLVGMRLQLQVELGRTGADFANYSVSVRGVMRADLALTHPDAFVLMSGITQV